MRQSHNGQRLPALFANNLKINYANIIDKLRNPLKQAIPRNHKQGTNPTATRKLPSTRTSETPRNQAIASLVIPLKGRKEAKQGRKKQ
jgi:hypothetical protein